MRVYLKKEISYNHETTCVNRRCTVIIYFAISAKMEHFLNQVSREETKGLAPVSKYFKIKNMKLAIYSLKL